LGWIFHPRYNSSGIQDVKAKHIGFANKRGIYGFEIRLIAVGEALEYMRNHLQEPLTFTFVST
jgi:hypothetical protein